MAPRANWKGFLRLSLVTCPVAIYPATSESEKISFNQLNRPPHQVPEGAIINVRFRFLAQAVDRGAEMEGL